MNGQLIYPLGLAMLYVSGLIIVVFFYCNMRSDLPNNGLAFYAFIHFLSTEASRTRWLARKRRYRKSWICMKHPMRASGNSYERPASSVTICEDVTCIKKTV